jgi:predicted permease
MRFKEAWRLSRTPYIEVAFRSAQMNRAGSQSGAAFSRSDPKARVKAIIRSTRISKIFFTLFIAGGSAFPFLQYFTEHAPAILVSAISLSLLISLGYLILFLFQILPSFASSEPYSFLMTLPFDAKDFEFVTFLSFARTFDTQAIAAIVVQVGLVGFLTHSVFAAFLMLIVSSVNIVFGISIALYLARVFYKNMMRGGRSITSTISRFVFMISWGIAALSFGYIFYFVTYLTKYVDAAVQSNLTQPVGVVFTVVHPFSAALTITSVVYPTIYGTRGITELQILAYIASVIYLMIGVFAARRTLGVVASVAQGQGVNIQRIVAKEFLVKPRIPLLAYLQKDLRIASKSPSTAFLFAFPVFETIIIFFSVSSIAKFSATSIFSSMAIGLFFIMFMSSALLNTEASSIDLTLSLPLRPAVIVNAKALLVALTYLPVPIVMTILVLHKGLTSPLLVLIPYIEIFAVASAGAAQIGMFIVARRKVVVSTDLGQQRTKSIAVFQPAGFSLIGGRDVIRLAKSLIVGVVLLGIPIAAYVVSWYLGHSHFSSIIVMGLAGVIEFVAVEYLINR